MITKKQIALILGPLLWLTASVLGFTVWQEFSLQLNMAGILCWMLTWWITQAIPIGVTSLLPMVLFPLSGILDLKSTTANYANPIIYLFFGGFVLGIALERWNLHRRIALNILKLSGDSPQRIVFGSMLATALLSMWISNTATAVMMLPIGMSVVGLLSNQLESPKAATNFGLAVMLGIAYAANLGGMTTLIGTPPNLVLASLLSESAGVNLGFATWLYFALPLVAGLFILVFQLNTKLLFPIRVKKVPGALELISKNLKDLGKISNTEKRVLTVVIATALMWIFRSQITQLSLFENLSDPLIAVLAAIVLFVVPSDKNEEQKRLLVWSDMQKMPWGILLLFGGGISLAKGMEATHLVTLVGTWINSLDLNSLLVLILVITLFAVFLTEVMSNVALVSVFIPVSFVIATAFNVTEITLAIPLTLGASCAFMFPISTPPNAIVFSSGHIKMDQMAKAGIWLNLLSVILISLYCNWMIPVFF